MKVLNRHIDRIPADAVYVGRGTPWGNPFIVGKHGNRGQVIEKFRKYLEENPALVERAKRELRGKDLVCSCAPAYCHAEVWLEIANDACTHW